MASIALVDQCGLCGKSEDLLRCTGCQAMFYCSRDHQVADRDAHKAACKKVARKRKESQFEETKIRNTPGGDPFSWGNAFETGVGRFWSILETRDYMRARFAWASALGDLGTRTGVEEQLAHFMDMLRLCRGDNMGIRSLVPALMLRLNQDQECYDFAKWWFTMGSEGDYDWGNMDLPYLSIKGADVFEEVKFFTGRFPDLAQLVAVTLLKIKLVLDLEALQKSTHTAGSKVPREVLDDIRSHVPRSPVISNNRELVQSDDHKGTIKTLREQIRQLYQAVARTNEHYWKLLLSGKEPQLPSAFSKGSIEEAQLSFSYTIDAWYELPAAIDFIRTLQA
ncbi:hypothetical protein BDV12DRAFT_49041 [Aspergillus spectabilis]